LGGADNTCGKCAKFGICRTVGEPGFSADCRAHICPDVSPDTGANAGADYRPVGLSGADFRPVVPYAADHGTDYVMQDPDNSARLSGDRRRKS